MVSVEDTAYDVPTKTRLGVVGPDLVCGLVCGRTPSAIWYSVSNATCNYCCEMLSTDDPELLSYDLIELFELSDLVGCTYCRSE